MKPKTTLPSIVALLFATASSPAAIVTGPVLNPANSHFYYLLAAADWISSENEALTLGGHLATINDQAENDWVFSTFSAGSTRNLWNGLNDAAAEGTFVWASGEPLIYSNFAGSEPNNNGNEDYVHWYTTFYGNRWNDVNVSGFGTTFGVVESVVAPEPSAILLAAFGVASVFLRRRTLRTHERNG